MSEREAVSGPAGPKAPGASPSPLLTPWSGPAGGVPPFDRVGVPDFEPSLEAAIDEMLAEVDRIATDPAPPTFENTLAALERAGYTLERVDAVIGVWRSTLSTPELRAIEPALAAREAAAWDRITQNTELFRRIEAVHAAIDDAGLTAEQRRLTWDRYTDFVRAGAALDAKGKERLAEINQRLAELSTRFDQNVLADEDENHVVLEREAELEGLPEADRRAASAAATRKGLEGKWLIENTRSSVESFLAYHPDRALRRRVWETFLARGETVGERDNRPVLAEILALRKERATLLGYASHAHWALEKTMAGTPERALALVEEVWRRALSAVEGEVERMLEFAREDGLGEILPHDYRYYAERANRALYQVDWREVEPYLELGRLRDGMFWVAGELFGLEFTPLDVPVYHPDVRAWQVAERGSGRLVGLFYFDPFGRPGKKSGAWMNSYRRQRALGERTLPVVSNNSNFPTPPPGAPALVSWTDAVTLFHEFGHALHGLLSDVTYPSLSGTGVSPDYVELPSQLLEFWLSTPELLRRFALHHETGEPIPGELVERIEAALRGKDLLHLTEQLASTLIDLRLHLSGEEGAADPEGVERATLEAYGCPVMIAPRHRPPHFSHLFSGDHYAAKYWSYLWADVIAADAMEAFREAGGMFDRDVAARLRAHVLSRGNAVDPAEGYRAFRGRDPESGALMRVKGFAA